MKKWLVVFVLFVSVLGAQAKKLDYDTKATPQTLKMFEAITQSNAKKVAKLLKKETNKESLAHYLYVAAFTCGTKEGTLWYHYPHRISTKADEYTFQAESKFKCDPAKNTEIIRLLLGAGARTDLITYREGALEPISGTDKKRQPLGLQTVLHFLKKGNAQGAKELAPKMDKCMVYLTEITSADPHFVAPNEYISKWKQNRCSTDTMKMMGLWSDDLVSFMIIPLSDVYTNNKNRALTLGKSSAQLNKIYADEPVSVKTLSPQRKIVTYRAVEPTMQNVPDGLQKAVDYIYTMDNDVATQLYSVVVVNAFDKDDLWDPEFVQDLKTATYY